MMTTIRKFLAVVVSFVSNYIVVKLFWTFAWLLTPIGRSGVVKTLKALLVYLHITPVQDNLITAVSLLSLIVPILVYRLEFVQRITLWLMGARHAAGEEKQRIADAFSVVCERSGTSIEDYRLYTIDNNILNAFAFGRNHIAVTKPLMRTLTREQLTGVLAHEAGHLKHGDTKMLTLTACMQNVGQLAVNILCGIFTVCGWVAKIPLVGLAAAILSWFIALTVVPLQFLVNLPSNLVMLYLSRQDEYAADRYACELGLGGELYDGLALICSGEQRMSFLQRIQSTHPDSENRLKRIREFVEKQ